jgi:hypothetical protein
MKKLILMGIVVILQFSIISGQYIEKDEIKDNRRLLIGILSLDSGTSFENSQKTLLQTQNENIGSKKSPFLAGALSFAIPGAGEFYEGNYLKTAVFVAVEAAAVAVAVIYNNKGINQTNYFQNFSAQHWSVYRYADWTLTNIKTLNPNLNPANYSGLLDPKTQTVNWTILNQLENDVAGNGQQVPGSFYSHQLFAFGTESYFEETGKYSQFNVGWDDFGKPNQSNYLNTPNPYDPTRGNLTPEFIYYSIERGKANFYYNVSSKAVLVVIANHILSAVDAAWTAAKINKNIDVSTSFEKYDNGINIVYYPELNVQLSF